MTFFRDEAVDLAALGDPTGWDETITTWFAHAIHQSNAKLTVKIGHRFYQRVAFYLDSDRYKSQGSCCALDLVKIGATEWKP